MTSARYLAACGAGLVLMTVLALSLHISGELGIGSDERMAVFVGFAGIASLLYAGAVLVVLRRLTAGRQTLWLILGVAVLLRAMVAFSPSFLSSDLYRYVWDGRVQQAGINPYRYIPADPALETLRDDTIFPHINRADYAPTIYPPVAEAFFFATAAISPTTRAMKLAMTLLDLVTIGVLMVLLGKAGLPRERIVIYAWHPLPVWEFAGNGHVDALAIALIGLAMLVLVGRRPLWAAALLTGAILVKFLPAVLLPAFWRARQGGRWNWQVPAVVAAVTVTAYLTYSSAGRHVFGFLGGYTREEGLTTGSGLYPVLALGRLLPLPETAGRIYLALLAGVLALLGLWMAFSAADPADPRRLAGRVVVMTTVLTAGLSPHYPWYFCWLVPASALVPTLSVLYLSLASFLIYLDPIHTDLLWPSLVYVPFALLALADLVRHPLRPASAVAALPGSS